jgi:hypothetical protein
MLMHLLQGIVVDYGFVLPKWDIGTYRVRFGCGFAIMVPRCCVGIITIEADPRFAIFHNAFALAALACKIIHREKRLVFIQ